MDSLDALGPRPERHGMFDRRLLSHADEPELTAIVEQAAKALSTPIALVTLVLEQIQFFKAQYGLPPDLAASRATSRDVSFCQFVVRDEDIFEVTDAVGDERVPKHLVEAYGIRSYLGVPIRADESVMGSLCVIDTKARSFSEEDRKQLKELGAEVNRHLRTLAEDRRRRRASLLERVSGPALSELSEAIAHISAALSTAQVDVKPLEAFHHLLDFQLAGGSVDGKVLRRNLDSARLAYDALTEALDDVDAGVGDALDSVEALEHVFVESPTTHLSEVLVSGQELARFNIRNVGGAPLPDLPSDPVLATSRPLAVAVLAMCLSAVAGELVHSGLESRIRLDIDERDASVGILVSADGLEQDAIAVAAGRLNQQVGQDATMAVEATDDAIELWYTRALAPVT